MGKKKWSVVSILTMVLLMVLTACGGGSSAPSATAKPAETAATASAPAATAAAKPEQGKGNVIMITDVGGVNDQSFNQSAWEGLQKLKAETGAEVSFIESKQPSEYQANLDKAIEGSHDLIWGIGFAMNEAVLNAAKENPDQKYAIIDYSYGDQTPANLAGVLFQDNENSFLVGYLAAKMTKTNKVGFIGGMTGDAIGRFENGFKAGVALGAKELGKEVKIDVQYAESFTDAAKGKAIAKSMYQQGCDVVFHAAGNVGTGVIEAAKELNKWVIGVDIDQSYLAPEQVLASTIKGVGTAMDKLSTELIKEGKFTGGTTVVYGLKDKSVDIAYGKGNLVPEDVKAAVEAVKAKVVNGELSVPGTPAEYDAFVAGLK